MDDPCRYHWLEEGAGPEVRTFIALRASTVWEYQSEPGRGSPLLCLPTVLAWAAEFATAGFHVEQLGRELDNRSWHEGGGYLVPGETKPRDHHWLAVGVKLSLFDPTATQFAAYGSPALDRYIVRDGRTFPEWRRDRLAR